MNKLILRCFFLSVLIFITKSHARPISYAGGWTIMQMNDFNKHSFHFHYSPSIKYSIGYKSEFWRKKRVAVSWHTVKLSHKTNKHVEISDKFLF